jgi:hypothetical protein
VSEKWVEKVEGAWVERVNTAGVERVDTEWVERELWMGQTINSAWIGKVNNG